MQQLLKKLMFIYFHKYKYDKYDPNKVFELSWKIFKLDVWDDETVLKIRCWFLATPKIERVIETWDWYKITIKFRVVY